MEVEIPEEKGEVSGILMSIGLHWVFQCVGRREKSLKDFRLDNIPTKSSFVGLLKVYFFMSRHFFRNLLKCNSDFEFSVLKHSRSSEITGLNRTLSLPSN